MRSALIHRRCHTKPGRNFTVCLFAYFVFLLFVDLFTFLFMVCLFVYVLFHGLFICLLLNLLFSLNFIFIELLFFTQDLPFIFEVTRYTKDNYSFSLISLRVIRMFLIVCLLSHSNRMLRMKQVQFFIQYKLQSFFL